MAITTLDGLVAASPGQTEALVKSAMAGTFAAGDIISLWTATGNPGAGITPAGGLTAAVPDKTLAGAMSFVNPTGGMLSYISKLAASSSVPTAASTSGSFTGFTVSRPDANGAGTELWIECYTANTATAPSIILTYTNQSGTGSKVAGTVVGAAAMAIGLIKQVDLASGDTGVRSVQSYTKAATTAGIFGVTMIRRIAQIPCTLANISAAFDNFALGLPQIYDSACISAAFRINTGTAAPLLDSFFSLVQG
jgi:hypothetical protein